MKNKNKDYITNKDFLAEIIISKADDKLTRKAEKMMLLLADRAVKKMRYDSLADRDDCKQTGLLAMLTHWRSFKPEKSTNAFAYFTEVFKRGLAKGWGELYYKKGDDDRTSKTYSLDTGNDGQSMFGF